MYYTVYKITNLVNNKIYIGIHQTNNLDDGYMGSGAYLNRAKLKYGLENFTKEYLYFLDSYEDMCNKEKELVNKDFLLREDVYNLTLGGGCGFYYVNKSGKNLYGLNGTSGYGLENLLPFSIIKDRMIASNRWESHLQKLSISLKEQYSNGRINGFLGKTHTIETISKIKDAHRINSHQQGTKNSQFNTKWISNTALKISKKVDKDFEMENGWIDGRIINWDKFFNKVKDKPIKVEKVKVVKIKPDKLVKIKADRTLEYREYYKIYNQFGFEKFVELTEYKYSKQALVMAFKNYLPEFIPQNGKRRGIVN